MSHVGASFPPHSLARRKGGEFALIRRLAAAVALACIWAAPALAHPHVWVDAKAELVFNDKGELSAIRHIWQFDKDFTAFATLNLDANNDGKLTVDELAPLAQTNMDALVQYGYFTDVYVNGKKQAFAKPQEYWLDFHQERLTLFYTLPLKTPVAIQKTAMIVVGDPEYFVAINFIKGAEVHLVNAPKNCVASYRPPQELTARTMALLSAIPADQHDLPPDLAQAASVLSNTINVNCGLSGAAMSGPQSTLSSTDLVIKPGTPGAAPPADAAIAPPSEKQNPGFWSWLKQGIFK